MKPVLRCALAALAMAVICFMLPLGDLVSADHRWLFHLDGPLRPIVLPLLLDVGIVGLLSFGLLVSASRYRRLGIVVFPAVVALLPCILLEQTARLSGWRLPWAAEFGLILVAVIGWLAWVRALNSRPGWFAGLRENTVAILGYAGVAALALLGELSWILWQAGTFHRAAPVQARTSLHQTHRSKRVIWIVFDELSYQQLYERRFPGLALPAFDRFASQATVFTHVTPVATFTELAIPKLMTGVAATMTRPSLDGATLELGPLPGGHWQRTRAEDTVFGDALRLGYSTAVAGWYNPYCRTLATVLDRCRWTYAENYLMGMRPHSSVLGNMAAPVRLLAAHVAHPRSAGGREDRLQDRLADYQTLQAASDEMLNDETLSFVFLHLPLPHPPGFYNRRTGQFSAGGSYIDNLALADKTLAHIRGVLERNGDWDSSTVLVMGDHSWRTSLTWRHDPVWTAEDEAASHGGEFDPRPGYLLKLPHQTAIARVDTVYDAIHTRALLDQLLEGRLGSPGDVAAFASSAR